MTPSLPAGRICFIPSVPLELELAPRVVPIKGAVPQQAYPFSLIDLYPDIPAANPLSAYRLVAREFAKVDAQLHGKLHLREHRALPAAHTAGEALALLTGLFDPTCHRTDGLWRRPPIATGDQDHLFRLDSALPFRLNQASRAKMLHTLVWIDTNIKVNVERVTARFPLSRDAGLQIVESALKIYSLLVKQQDYWLARSMNFNHSMFLQDRILNLLLGDALYLESGTRAAGELANDIAVELLQGLGPLSLGKLGLASIFMGVVWTANGAIQDLLRQAPQAALAEIAAQLQARTGQLAVDDFGAFWRELGTTPQPQVVVVLDDNGESVFDLALFQQLLREIGGLRVALVVNRFPVSNNISLAALRALLRRDFFSDLHRWIHEKRVRLVVEEQCFRSFELAHLRPGTRRLLSAATCLYIKGANFFETFQPPDRPRYHAFTVFGEMARTLTGYPEGSGIMVRVPPGQPAFTYHGPEHIETLRHLLVHRE